MLKSIASAFIVVLLVLSGPAVWIWDRRPAGVPSDILVRAPIFRFKIIDLKWPESQGAVIARQDRELAAARLDLRQCRANEAAQAGAIVRQNAAVAALGADGRRRQAEAAKALDRQRSLTTAARNRAEDLLAQPLVGADACLRFEEADRRLLESLK